MTPLHPKRCRLRIAYLLAPTVLGATWRVIGASPASAHIPPLRLCSQLNEGDTQHHGFVDGTEDVIIWRCTKGREMAGTPMQPPQITTTFRLPAWMGPSDHARFLVRPKLLIRV